MAGVLAGDIVSERLQWPEGIVRRGCVACPDLPPQDIAVPACRGLRQALKSRRREVQRRGAVTGEKRDAQQRCENRGNEAKKLLKTKDIVFLKVQNPTEKVLVLHAKRSK